VREVEAGLYRGAGYYSQHGFLSMERTLVDSIDAHWELEFSPIGEARACVAGSRRQGGSVSHYASDDGKDHHNEHTSEWFVCVSGTWRSEGRAADGVSIRFDRASHFDRELVEEAYDIQVVSPWVCFAMNETKHGLGSVLACRLSLPTRPGGLERAGLFLGGTPRDGSWEMRDEVSRPGEALLSEEHRPWLVFGAEGGVRVESRDSGRGGVGGDGVQLTLERAKLEMVRKPKRVEPRVF
jgi:hypothetical protein